MDSVDKLETLLENIEENIFYLQNFKTHRKNISDIFTIERSVSLLNVDTGLNSSIVDLYNNEYNIYSKDIDILNLVLKYMQICGKIVTTKNKHYLGVKEIYYHPSSDIECLNESYFISKYLKKQNHYMYNQNKDMLDISLKIIIPFTIRYCVILYEKLV